MERETRKCTIIIGRFFYFQSVEDGELAMPELDCFVNGRKSANPELIFTLTKERPDEHAKCAEGKARRHQNFMFD